MHGTNAGRWGLVSAAANAIADGGSSLDHFPGLLKRIIREEAWREFMTPSGTIEHFNTFVDFITNAWGLHTTLAMVLRLCNGDMEALDLLDLVTTEHRGAKEGNQSAAKTKEPPVVESQPSLIPSEEQETNHNNVMICLSEDEKALQGNTRTYALRRLRTERPDVHARVLAGEISPHRGMIEAGFRHEPTPLDYLHKYWRKVPAEDRLRFLTEMLTPAERRALSAGLDAEEC